MTLRRMQTVTVIVILALLLFAGAKAGAQTRDRTVTPATTQEAPRKKDGSPIYYCEAATKAGGKCKRHVKNQGTRCWMHQGK